MSETQDLECDHRVKRSDGLEERCYLRPKHHGQHLYARLGFEVSKGWQFNLFENGGGSFYTFIKDKAK